MIFKDCVSFCHYCCLSFGQIITNHIRAQYNWLNQLFRFIITTIIRRWCPFW